MGIRTPEDLESFDLAISWDAQVRTYVRTYVGNSQYHS